MALPDNAPAWFDKPAQEDNILLSETDWNTSVTMNPWTNDNRNINKNDIGNCTIGSESKRCKEQITIK